MKRWQATPSASEMAVYLDTSALVKLVVDEPESSALLAWLQEPGRVPASSDLARTELLRATRRAASSRMVRAREVLDSLTLLRLSTATFERAAMLEPLSLRSLDAVHVASALELGDDLAGFVTYDDRQVEALTALGIPVEQPAAGR